MADLAHDASGPASSEPAGITQQIKQPASSDSGKLRVFISYSRDDLDFADQLNAALDTCGFECLIDRHSISGGEDWKRRLGNLISEADTVVFVLSPSSARSEICDWEVEEATRLNKRILPVHCRPLEGANPPPRLRELNYIFFYEEPKIAGSGFGTGLANLVTALNTDFDWLREHTRYLQRAMEWHAGGRPTNRLLSGNDILEANAWAARRPKSAPEPTALHLDFIRASEEEAEARLSEQRKQLEAMAAAQAEREKALHDAEEALKQAADAQRRRARIRNIALVATSGLAAVAVLVALFAFQQRMTVDKQRHEAEAILSRAMDMIVNLQKQMDIESKNDALALLQAGAEHGGVEAMENLGLSYANGLFGPQDYVKAREWFEKAATDDDTDAMTYLGVLYEKGQGGPQDFVKARQWFEKAAARGDAGAKKALERIPIREAETAGRYAEASRLEEELAAKLEAEETKSDGKPGERVATELNRAAWYALFAREFTNALAVADRAHALFPDNLMIESNRVHALMFLGHGEEARALYLAHKGEAILADKLWEQAIAEDFAQFRKVGLTNPMVADIEKELGISR